MDKYGLIGYPLGHSFSISYFNEKFKNEGIDAIYENYEIPTIEQLPEVLDTNPELRGLNVTIPYKEKVISYLDGLSPEASEIGAVNVIKVEHKGKKTVLKGYNSDVIGFTRSIEPLLESYHKKALILGTGGASKAIDFGLRSLKLETLKVSRSGKDGAIRYTDVTPEMMKEYNVIVNCTPCGMFPHADECPDLLMMPWTTTLCSTTSYTTPMRHCSSPKARRKVRQLRMDWRCCSFRPSPAGNSGIVRS